MLIPCVPLKELGKKRRTLVAALREVDMGSSESDLKDKVQNLEKAQEVQAATQAGAQATQAATQAGGMATMGAAQAGMAATVAAGGIGLIIGIFLGLAIANSR
jgi:hypothetical protein